DWSWCRAGAGCQDSASLATSRSLNGRPRCCYRALLDTCSWLLLLVCPESAGAAQAVSAISASTAYSIANAALQSGFIVNDFGRPRSLPVPQQIEHRSGRFIELIDGVNTFDCSLLSSVAKAHRSSRRPC